jgi:hypothetical protein
MALALEGMLADPPKFHERRDGTLTNDWRLGDRMMLVLNSHLREGMQTLETGAGLSTVLFASKGCDHTVISPGQALWERIRSYCVEHGVSVENVRYIAEKSEDALPRLDRTGFDLALLDGRHAFPTPFIDWYYASQRLKPGGLCLIDDLHIHTCHMLMDFLAEAPDWEVIERDPRAAVARKLGDDSARVEWRKQPWTWNRSRARPRLDRWKHAIRWVTRQHLWLEPPISW